MDSRYDIALFNKQKAYGATKITQNGIQLIPLQTLRYSIEYKIHTENIFYILTRETRGQSFFFIIIRKVYNILIYYHTSSTIPKIVSFDKQWEKN